jgi:hypothetical protein
MTIPIQQTCSDNFKWHTTIQDIILKNFLLKSSHPFSNNFIQVQDYATGT